MFGIGEYPIGGFPDADSVSIADPLPGLLSDPSVPKEFLLRATVQGEQPILSDSGDPILNDDGFPILSDSGDVSIDLSSSGYVSAATDSPYKLFTESLVRSYHFSADLPLDSKPRLSGGASLGIGDIVVKNSDGSLDREATYDWLASDLSLYIGRKSSSLADFTRFCLGVAAGIVWDLDGFSILHRDLRLKLQKRLQQNRYYGTGPCLRFDGAGDYVDYGDILDRGATDSFAIQILAKSSTTGTVKVLASKCAAALLQGFAFYFDASNNLKALIGDGTTQVTATYAAASLLDNSRFRRFTMVVDRTAQRIYIYVNNDLVATSADISGVGSLANAVALRVGAFSGGESSWQGDLDDFRFWSISRTQTEISADAYREISATTGLEIYSKFNDNTLTTASDSSGNGRNGTITGATWVGSLEGDTSLSSTVKPLLFGKKRQIFPKLVDPTRLIYQVHDGLQQAIDDVLDSGDSLTFGSTVSDIQSSTPAAGTYNVSLTAYGSFFRLGSSPVGVITCEARGDAAGSLTYKDDVAGIVRKVITQFVSGMSDSDLNLQTFTSLTAAATATVGFYFDTDINVDAALDEITSKGGSCWWTPDRVSKISVGRIENPDNLTPDVMITEDDLIEPKKGGTYKRSPIGVRVGQVVLGYRRYNTTLSDDQVAGVVDIATRKDFGEEYRFVTATDPDRSADSDTLTVLTEIDLETEAQVEADRLLDIWKVDRSNQIVSLNTGLLSYFIGTVFEVTIDRYDTKQGKKFIVYGLTEDMGQHGSIDKFEPKLFG